VLVPQLDEILRDALVLDVQDRAALAEELLASLDDVLDEEAEQVWATEAKRRLDDYHAGRAHSVPAKEVAEKATKLFH
jgi:putative addiction module component (TIGR02574 family)